LIFIKIENSFELKLRRTFQMKLEEAKYFWKKDNEIFAKEKSF